MGLKPVESTQFTSALKHRPPEERTLSAACKACPDGLRAGADAGRSKPRPYKGNGTTVLRRLGLRRRILLALRKKRVRERPEDPPEDGNAA